MRGLAALLIVLGLAAPVRAQPADVAAQIKLIDNQPADLDRPTWKEKRRDAARKLAQSKDKRAVPILIKLAENETFDIIGEIAIEGLGTMGDPSAVPTLQKIVADTARDKGQRDLARKSLARLGAGEAVADKPPPPPPPPPPDTGGGTTPPGNGSQTPPPPPPPDTGGLIGVKASSDVPALPELPDDTLAAYERVTFAAGTANFAYDTLQKRLDFDADVAGTYQKRVERPAFAWGWDAGAHVVGGLVNQTAIMGGLNHSQQRGLELVGTGDGEARFYTGQLYGVGKAAAALQLDYASDLMGNMMTNRTNVVTGDLQVALGGGWGRVLDIGAAIRVRRLARTLDAARALGRPIDASTSKKLQLTWWALRGERSAYRALVATVAVLREAGILLSEPDAGLSYEILNVLRDTWVYVRPSGLDIQAVFGEGYLQRPGNNYPNTAEQGRVEQLLAQAGYGQQLDDDKVEIAGTAYARLRLFAPDPQVSPWALGATASLRRFTYGDHGDPFGLVDLTGDVGLSDDGLMMSQKSLRIAGQLGFTYYMNQASGLRLAAQVAEDGGALFVGAQLTATYGLLGGTFAR